MNLLAKITKARRRPHLVVHIPDNPARDPWVSLVGANGEPWMRTETYDGGIDAARDSARRLADDTGWRIDEVREP